MKYLLENEERMLLKTLRDSKSGSRDRTIGSVTPQKAPSKSIIDIMAFMPYYSYGLDGQMKSLKSARGKGPIARRTE